ncbi:hypothetical protein ACE414_09850 [Alteromonas macleodii]|uniref:hypothetical protein n=1 Tax=Alteromonas macleodii TaxID=28108 RepID=UPI0036515328
MKHFLTTIGVIPLFGCVLTGDDNTQPETLAERQTIYTYIPLDPLPAKWDPSESCKNQNERLPLVHALPDQTMRMSIKKYSANGNISFTGFASTAKNDTFEVTYDYGMSDTVPLELLVAKRLTTPDTNYVALKSDLLNINDNAGERSFTFVYLPYEGNEKYNEPYTKLTIPVYIGIGVRMRANFTVLDADVDLGGLFSIAAAARNNKISGSLVLQTIGATGKDITATLPVPNEINESSLVNSLVTMGSVKAMLHEADSVSPRVLGFYNPFGGGEEFVNTMTQALANERPEWFWRCDVPLNNTEANFAY